MTQWPAGLRRLASIHTPAAVYAAGLAVLGFPPTWGTTASELGTLVRALTGRGG